MTGIRKWAVLLLGVFVLALGLAACGGDDDTSSSSSGGAETAAETQSGSGDEALEAAQAAVAEAEKPPAAISLPPLSKKPPANQTVALVTCPVTNCVEVEEAAKEATALLGWNLEVFQGELTPEKQVAALDEAVQSDPVGIIDIMIVPPSVLAKPLAEAESGNIPVVGIGDGEEPTPPIITALVNLKEADELGKLMADWIYADSEGEAANVLTYTTKENATLAATAKATGDQLASICPDCKVQAPEYSLADQGAGTKLPNEVVSFVQRNPDTEYIVFPTGAGTPGVGAALQAAGLEVKIIARSSSTVNQANIVDGIEAAGIGEEVSGNSWRGVDAIARTLIGDPVEECCAEPLGEYQLLTAENIEDPNVAWSTPDPTAAFKKIWLVE